MGLISGAPGPGSALLPAPSNRRISTTRAPLIGSPVAAATTCPQTAHLCRLYRLDCCHRFCWAFLRLDLSSLGFSERLSAWELLCDDQ